MIFSNTKLLVVASLITIILGFGLIWFGLKPASLEQAVLVENPPVATASATLGVNSHEVNNQRILVTEVIDGDTIKIQSGQTVRLLGIDTPETKDPRRPVECFGKEASNETKKLLLGKDVILEKDVSEADKYGRLLRYIYLPLEDGQALFVNDYLVRAGFASVLTYPPDVKFDEQLREAERLARQNYRGLWGKCK